MLGYIKILRINHWIKNLLIFAPIFFGLKLFDVILLLNGVVVFFSFSLLASAVYCFNDIIDLESDKTHPNKSRRPLAAGEVSIFGVVLLLLFCCFISLLLPIYFCLPKDVFFVQFVYLLMNILYSVWLKKIVIVDIFILSIGFVLRVAVGGIACNIVLSKWIVLLSFTLALFLAITKRMNDIHLKQDLGIEVRRVTRGYNEEYLKTLLSLTAAVSVVLYLLYCVSPEVVTSFNCDYIYFSTIFVLLCIFEFMRVTLVLKNSGNPTEVFYKNKIIKFSVIGWVVFFFIIVYLIR
jgi:decaprenyl-phosphate phosphoribosyltransferase